MRSPRLSAAVRGTERVMRIAHSTYIAAVPGYAVFLLCLFGWPTRSDATWPRNPMTVPVVVLSIISAILMQLVSKIVLSDFSLRRMLATEPAGETDDLSPQERRLVSIAPAFFVPFLAQLALGEAIALFGVVLGCFSHSILPFLPFGGLSLALLLRVPPSLDPFFERAENLLRSGERGTVPTRDGPH